MIDSSSDKSTPLRPFAVATVLLLIVEVVLLRFAGQLSVRHGLHAGSTPDVLALEWPSFVAWPTFMLIGAVMWLLPQLKARNRVSDGHAMACFLLLLLGIGVETVARTLLASWMIGKAAIVLGAAFQTIAAIIYLVSVRRDTIRSLHPSMYDVMLQIGAVWLVGSLAIHTGQSIAFMVGYEDALSAEIYVGLYKGFALGFVGNTGIWLLISTMPHFLDTREPGVRPGGFIVSYNVILLLWVLGEIWSLHYPYTWVRLPLSLLGVGLAASSVQLLVNLRVFDYLSASTVDRRRLVVRVASGAFIVCMLAATAIIAGLGIWLASTKAVALLYVGFGLRELLQVGMGSFLLIAVLASLLGPVSVAGVRHFLIWAAMVVGGVGLVIVMLVSLSGVLTGAEFEAAGKFGMLTSAVGHLITAIWLSLCICDR